MDRKCRPNDQSTDIILATNRATTNEITSPKKINSDVNPKDFTRKQAQTLTPFNTEVNPIDRSKFCFTDSKMQKQFNYDYHHWGANKKEMEIINKREKSPTLRLIERRTEITKAGNLRFQIW